MQKINKIILLSLLATLVAACGGGGGGGSSSSTTTPTTPTMPTTPTLPTTPTNATIELSLGTALQKPVFQCGSSADSLTADSAPNSLSVFESDPVRPIVLSANGQRLYVANAPANCLEIYTVSGDTIKLVSSVAVGLEPVAIAERNDNEVWVVNHLSDSVSIVRIDGTPRVLRTLQVGDEPRDIVFAGASRDRAFISAAFRGQNRPGLTDASFTTAAQGRGDVWVFDAAQLDDSLNGKPVAILNMFADSPRALAVSNDGRTVYAAPFMSGNQTTALHRDAVTGKKPALPNKSADNVTAPDTGLIVKFDGAAWRDEAGTNWSSKVKYTLPDYDVFAIDATLIAPVVSSQVSGVGTTLFNIAVHPTTGLLYVSNTQAQNQIRFEGSGGVAGTANTTVRGRIAESRISVVNVSSKTVDGVHLNPHVSFSLPTGAETLISEKVRSLSQPTALLFSPNGDTLYTAAFSSAKVAAIPTATFATGSYSPNALLQINVPDGPVGLALNAAGTRLYVYSRIAHSVSVIDTAAKTVLNTTAMFSPESTTTVTGRRFLYDANTTSNNGTTSCSSCHVFGDLDHLAWDLGNPDDATKLNTNAYVSAIQKTTQRFHPLKGPMTTQTLRGMAGNGPMHWRGDRIGANRQTVRGRLESLEEASFKEFNPAFVSLIGRNTPLSDSQMQSFTDFAMSLAMPPNPVRALDNSLNANQQAGRDVYFNQAFITLLGSCNTCHRLSPENKQFGTAGLMAFEGGRITENFKVPQLRNIYTKVGMFGFSAATGLDTGLQIRGFGFANDGSVDTLDTFFSDPVFNFPQPANTSRAQMTAFVMAMDSDLAPIVGQQVSWRSGSSAEVEARLTLLKQQALVTSPRPACDLVVRATIDGVSYNGLMQSDGSWAMRTGSPLSDTALKALATASQPLTFTCLPPGSGRRVALNIL